MVDRTITERVDDLDPTGQTLASERVRFSWNGADHEIDLGPENLLGLKEAQARCDEIMERYLSASRIVAPAKPRQSRRARQENAAICRKWLNQHGHDVGDRGRIPDNLVQKYRDAGSPTTW